MSEQNPSQPGNDATPPQQGQYPQGQYPQGQYPDQGQYPQGQYPDQGPYPQQGYPQSYDPSAYSQEGQYPQSGQYVPPGQYPPGYPQAGYDPHAYPQAAYGQHPAYPAQPQWDPTPPPENKTPGLVGLLIVAVSTVVLAVAMYLLGGQFGAFAVDYGIDATTNPDPSDPAIIALSQAVSGMSVLATIATVVGVIGWVVSIVATVRRSGRRFGIWGIVLGIVAPLLGVATLIAGMWPYVAAMA